MVARTVGCRSLAFIGVSVTDEWARLIQTITERAFSAKTKCDFVDCSSLRLMSLSFRFSIITVASSMILKFRSKSYRCPTGWFSWRFPRFTRRGQTPTLNFILTVKLLWGQIMLTIGRGRCGRRPTSMGQWLNLSLLWGRRPIRDCSFWWGGPTW